MTEKLSAENEQLRREIEQLRYEIQTWKEMDHDDYKIMVFQQEKVIIDLRASIEERIKQQAKLIKEIKKLNVK